MFNCKPKFNCSKIQFCFYTGIETQSVWNLKCFLSMWNFKCPSLQFCPPFGQTGQVSGVTWMMTEAAYYKPGLSDCECSEQSFVLAQFNCRPTPVHPLQKQNFYWNWNIIWFMFSSEEAWGNKIHWQAEGRRIQRKALQRDREMWTKVKGKQILYEKRNSLGTVMNHRCNSGTWFSQVSFPASCKCPH